MGEHRTAPGKPYTCELCKGEFIGSRTHEDCVAEMETIEAAEVPPGERAVVCHDCWVKILRANGHHVSE